MVQKKNEDQRYYIMKIKGPFVKVVLLNETNKHPLFKLNFNIGIFLTHLNFFQCPYYSISTTFHDSYAIEVAPHKQMY